MLKENRSETDDLHRTIAAKDVELLNERNVEDNLYELNFCHTLSSSIVHKSKSNFVNS